MQTNMTDEARELAIAECAIQYEAAATLADKRAVWLRMRTLINSRSAAQIARMEAEKGLSRPKAA